MTLRQVACDMETNQLIKEASQQHRARAIPVNTIILIGVSLIAGMLLAFTTVNFLSKQQITISTSALVSFVFTVALGAGSLILAILSISLSRQAEDALIRRSDEGIRLQNEVYLRTSEVLGTIQAS